MNVLLFTSCLLLIYMQVTVVCEGTNIIVDPFPTHHNSDFSQLQGDLVENVPNVDTSAQDQTSNDILWMVRIVSASQFILIPAINIGIFSKMGSQARERAAIFGENIAKSVVSTKKSKLKNCVSGAEPNLMAAARRPGVLLNPCKLNNKDCHEESNKVRPQNINNINVYMAKEYNTSSIIDKGLQVRKVPNVPSILISTQKTLNEEKTQDFPIHLRNHLGAGKSSLHKIKLHPDEGKLIKLAPQ
ncbi:uncharacterized protein CMU_017460 [Cryptosporidium muris RN66]|uniref:Uncharacterized protein n=1 Tax=Cryptosporidium muris (strain RN66) TaxID=441375 RepID=B6ACY9_CRYMR|nr:uncharacterized protein CMU_017460 [Cryptosporidium muris RN66]EEA05993.1 hypothetical protein CMU_017460 [Cryptosporidium muris RN66]|eukprot:XP_002140342.1 hypothetical protein [Cryptosporidium muris RN66]